MNQNKWLKSAEKTFLLDKDVHIWLIRYDEADQLVEESDHILSLEEKKRAARFHFEIDNIRFTTTRTLLKKILSEVTSKPINEITFNFNKYGKPGFSNKNCKIYFNISHSGNLGLIAVTDLAPIGIDVEQFRKEMTTGAIAKRFFSEVEVKEFLQLDESDKLQGFFNCWSRKEAFIKAVGRGLSMPLNTFDVSLRPNEPAKLLAVRYKNENAKLWTMNDIAVDTGYAAAFVIKEKIFSTNFWSAY